MFTLFVSIYLSAAAAVAIMYVFDNQDERPGQMIPTALVAGAAWPALVYYVVRKSDRAWRWEESR